MGSAAAAWVAAPWAAGSAPGSAPAAPSASASPSAPAAPSPRAGGAASAHPVGSSAYRAALLAERQLCEDLATAAAKPAVEWSDTGHELIGRRASYKFKGYGRLVTTPRDRGLLVISARFTYDGGHSSHRYGWIDGTVTAWLAADEDDPALFRIKYDDGDDNELEEDLAYAAVERHKRNSGLSAIGTTTRGQALRSFKSLLLCLLERRHEVGARVGITKRGKGRPVTVRLDLCVRRFTAPPPPPPEAPPAEEAGGGAGAAGGQRRGRRGGANGSDAAAPAPPLQGSAAPPPPRVLPPAAESGTAGADSGEEVEEVEVEVEDVEEVGEAAAAFGFARCAEVSVAAEAVTSDEDEVEEVE